MVHTIDCLHVSFALKHSGEIDRDKRIGVGAGHEKARRSGPNTQFVENWLRGQDLNL
jgi:hypothetical protein